MRWTWYVSILQMKSSRCLAFQSTRQAVKHSSRTRVQQHKTTGLHREQKESAKKHKRSGTVFVSIAMIVHSSFPCRPWWLVGFQLSISLDMKVPDEGNVIILSSCCGLMCVPPLRCLDLLTPEDPPAWACCWILQMDEPSSGHFETKMMNGFQSVHISCTVDLLYPWRWIWRWDSSPHVSCLSSSVVFILAGHFLCSILSSQIPRSSASHVWHKWSTPSFSFGCVFGGIRSTKNFSWNCCLLLNGIDLLPIFTLLMFVGVLCFSEVYI